MAIQVVSRGKWFSALIHLTFVDSRGTGVGVRHSHQCILLLLCCSDRDRDQPLVAQSHHGQSSSNFVLSALLLGLRHLIKDYPQGKSFRETNVVPKQNPIWPPDRDSSSHVITPVEAKPPPTTAVARSLPHAEVAGADQDAAVMTLMQQME
jgi:hypothetical protein